MIIGIGLDLIEISRIKEAYENKKSFSERVLTAAEHALFSRYPEKRKMEFLAGRFAAKEAYSKAMGTGIGKVGFQDIEILPDKDNKPTVTRSPFEGNSFVSITHTDSVAAAQVILEKNH
ncbi:holo-ACP synthase [Lacticigenium naphthae]|uniref:holo-ACP synthase n=1 Tax=Lacticigenium naphthae TaxID=515351 RepID=UPI0004178F47|nr:holo-ACP synthase [Lacticigenium naphthae]